jgi:hypothetical protein
MDAFSQGLEAVDCGGEVVVTQADQRPGGLIFPLSHPPFDFTTAQQQRRDDSSTAPGSKRRLMGRPKSRCPEELIENVFRHR